MRSVPLSVYIPGNTPVHRVPAAAKFIGLIVFVIAAAVLATTPTRATCVLGVVASGYLLARIPLRVAWNQLWPALPLLTMLGGFQWWQNTLIDAITLMLMLLASIAAAVLLTLTTTIAEMMHSLETMLAPTARWGVPVESISLAISLTIRLIPLQLNAVNEVLDARKARGVDFSLSALGTPVVIRSIRRARAIADALWARGVGD
ncbi:Energy-coupling factor transporter transmembrane protein EcfT [Corynebacterium ciconiae DSM 44920]|uniref:energy-coupling factor transporter transmembrane component T family protein n=1 Tax=Corynebacterium ciconiae TaxID=227319 RepID=UPI0003610E36|nr:energy-coupling factor transporter transmembrane protein EcfT [Corynebacterium ciconiae]WKD61416.1 Energy-coupling factor transporter transmembrane protein EcfT [Corynebacterium ciconiae DSM 44920]